MSKSLEYSYNDWAISHVARKVGAIDEANQLLRRSFSFKNLFDLSSGFFRPKRQSGSWTKPFDPKNIGHISGRRDYTECNAWQTLFGIMHDPKGLIDLLGGTKPFIEKLDLLFSQSSDLPPEMPPDVAGLVGQYAHGNEPCHHIAYLYAYAGEPHKTQSRVHSLLTTMYDNQPNGLAGNEDCGQMSAWYILSSIGFYAVDPVSTNYVFGSPLFDRVEIDMGPGRTLVCETRRSSTEEIYIQSVTLNGQDYKRSWFSHRDVREGAHFIFTMGREPNPQFGSRPEDRPPSASAAIRQSLFEN